MAITDNARTWVHLIFKHFRHERGEYTGGLFGHRSDGVLFVWEFRCVIPEGTAIQPWLELLSCHLNNLLLAAEDHRTCGCSNGPKGSVIYCERHKDATIPMGLLVREYLLNDVEPHPEYPVYGCN